MGWLREHDPGFAALRRAGRTAVVMPSMFAIGDRLIGNPVLATFAAFGSFATLAFVDFAGTIRDRLQAEAALALAGCVLICIGTLVSRSTPLAVIAMTLVAFGVLFAGVVSSVLAGASTSLLLAFILPVSLPGPVSSIPDRLAGWGLASAAALVATALLWPAPASNPLRDAAIRACRALAARLRAEVARAQDGDSSTASEHDAAVTAADAAVAELQSIFLATPYRPTGLSTAARTLIRLVDELRWLNTIVSGAAPRRDGTNLDRSVCRVESLAATALGCGAELLDDPERGPDGLRQAQDELTAARSSLERSASVDATLSALDPAFRAQGLSFVVSQIATNIDFATAAERRTWTDRLMGRQPVGLATTLSAAHERAGSHAARHSVWLQNSIRGAIALGLAVLVAKTTGVSHAFWVVLGTLSVLRSNALNTGQSVLRGLLGTGAGFLVGAALVAIIGTNTTLLWFLLPVAVLLAGLAPAAVSFAAGQAAFTLTLLILFNILQPEGWRIGLVRIEDVALGFAVSLLVGLLFWPRGARAALRHALADAYIDSARYLTGAVEFGIGRFDGGATATAEAAAAAAASRRLDDTFRAYLAERGAKPVGLAHVTSLVTGVVGLRLAGDAVLDLWRDEGPVATDHAAVRRELLADAALVDGWYRGFAAGLLREGPVPEPLGADALTDARLAKDIVDEVRGRADPTGVRMIWTGDQLDAARRLQATLVGPARAAVAQSEGQ